MKKNIEFEQLKQMITYWIEVNHLQTAIEHLVEDSDEIGEIYEPKNWFKDNQTGEDTSIMDVHVLLEDAADKCYEISSIVNKGFDEVIRLCVKKAPIVFGNYADRVNESNIEDIIRVFNNEVAIHDLYDYSMEEQFANFCREMSICCMVVIEEIPYDEVDSFDDLDDTELPFN